QHERGQEEPHAVRDGAHRDEQAGGEGLDGSAEPGLQELVDRQELAAEVGRDQEDRDDDPAQQVPEDELEKSEIASRTVDDPRNGDERDRGGLGRDDRRGDRPPRDVPAPQEILGCRLLPAGEEGSGCDDPRQVTEDDRDVEETQVARSLTAEKIALLPTGYRRGVRLKPDPTTSWVQKNVRRRTAAPAAQRGVQ